MNALFLLTVFHRSDLIMPSSDPNIRPRGLSTAPTHSPLPAKYSTRIPRPHALVGMNDDRGGCILSVTTIIADSVALDCIIACPRSIDIGRYIALRIR